MTALLAGFECARLHWNGHDLLESTGHVPWGAMTRHYHEALGEGVAGARDGLPWRHDAAERIKAVPPGVRVIWDLVHFDKPPKPLSHAVETCRRLPTGAEVIAVNEPSVGRRVSGMTRTEATRIAASMMRAASLAGFKMSWLTCDPFHHLHPDVFRATDALVGTGLIRAVGVNYYPHYAVVPLAEVLRAVADRYRLPVWIAETGFHDGHRDNRRMFAHLRDRRDWLAHVEAEVARSGVAVESVCWYPWLDMPPWDRPRGARWPCGWPGRAPAEA